MPLKTDWYLAKKTELWTQVKAQNPSATEEECKELYKKEDHKRWVESGNRANQHSVILEERKNEKRT